ncbi:MAG: uracil-DNA glycosylase [Armatimonadetes bacterium]|nr:uracil-DNA glycosylase [Armatimonadota bacterium]
MTQRSLFDDELPPRPAPEAPAVPELPAPTDPPLLPEQKAEVLERLREPALSCTRCELSRTRQHVVFGEGNPAAPLVFVGEGPGENEDATGRPFVGRAGKLLDDVLRENGMTREHVYICNILKCRAAFFEEGRARNRPPRPEEVDACRSWLDQQLAIIRPIVIVCLGAPAANVIIHRNFRMTPERGRWFTHSPYAPWVMAAFHPAYILRLHGPGFDEARASLVRDIAAAREKVIEVRRQLREQGPEAGLAGQPGARRSLFD